MKQHYFIAIPLSTKLEQCFDNQMSSWKKWLSFKNWVHPHDLHITLAFLGFATSEQLDCIKEQLHASICNHQPFTLTLSNPGVFGREEFPRIFWMGVEHSDPLINLQKNVSEFLERNDFSLDKRPYCPHITLARKWKNEQAFQLDKLNFSHIKPSLSWEVNDVVLYKTNMDLIPKYEPVYTWRLGELYSSLIDDN
ncbi:2'-5' RNA ligase [Bacillus solimangrovi]|uniref:RNA 2',3'-cyclic phosphodiesterase n=2 Tax=Bacillus solimangrovi TaxID=1305675 RepID=A0A1E5LCE1_9BACI|nr:2'-5' RNA ligase [Bacillus solimangrovi]